jgi:YebC/PmpR family DNA-binding regulatory protein
MAGHSKWANIQHRKGRVDALRGKLWSKMSKAIIVAAKMGGGDPNSNIRLRKAIDDAKAVSMPKDNIDRAIKKGTGELDGGNVDELVFEGYGPGGVAVMAEVLTDNRNRTAPEMRQVFAKFGGNLGNTGCVSYLFDRKGVFVFDAQAVNEERLTEVALEHGAEDILSDEGKFEVSCSPDAYQILVDAFEAESLKPEHSAISMVPQNMVELDAETAKQVLRLLEALDDHDDVQNVSTNLNITDEALSD